MYSPKIKESLIPRVYRISKVERIPMTRWVNRTLEESLSKIIDPEKSPPAGQGPASKKREDKMRDRE